MELDLLLEGRRIERAYLANQEVERIERIEAERIEHLARVANCSITKGYFSAASRRARAATKTDRQC